ncbi:unnamed protein product [Rhodiola kirilowii]
MLIIVISLLLAMALGISILIPRMHKSGDCFEFVLADYLSYSVALVCHLLGRFLSVDASGLAKAAQTGSKIDKSNQDSKVFTAAEVDVHNKRTDCWIIIKDRICDVTSYVEEHPEGDAILAHAGDDSTEGFFGSFNRHFGYSLTKEEADNLEKMEWHYKWPLPPPAGQTNFKRVKTETERQHVLGSGDFSASRSIKPKLLQHWLDVFKLSADTEFDSSVQGKFLSLCSSYQDILHHNKKPFYAKGISEDSNIMDAYIMHSLNHLLKSKDIITKNNIKLAKHEDNAAEVILADERFLDHGFTRPKVLILLPYASIAFRFVRRLIHLTPADQKVTVENLDRFQQEFGTSTPVEYEDGPSVLKKSKGSYTKPVKPSDFQALFDGNNNDYFMIGVKFTRKSIKLYSNFHQSDLIIASPLRLVNKIAEAEADKEKDVDYLSSVEVFIIDHADIISMQNWDHVRTVVPYFNRMPKKQHGTDFMRVKRWYLDGLSKYYRQTIVLGSYLTPEMNALFNRHCFNFQGKITLACKFEGVLPKLSPPVGQIYERFDAESMGDIPKTRLGYKIHEQFDADSVVKIIMARVGYFKSKVFPRMEKYLQEGGGIMIIMSSKLELVEVRAFLKETNSSFCELHEDTDPSNVSRARSWFYDGLRKIMLYTERAHFYHRYKIRGVRKLIMLSPPERKEFYPEILHMLHGSDDMTANVLFTETDKYKLFERLFSEEDEIVMLKPFWIEADTLEKMEWRYKWPLPSTGSSYQDILHHNKKPFYAKGISEDSYIMDAYIMHSLNHLFKSKDIITKNNIKLAKHEDNAAEVILADERSLIMVLILLPFASIALRFVRRLIQLTPSDQKVAVKNLDRFQQEFGTSTPVEYEDMPSVLKKFKGSYTKPVKPSDFQALFDGDNNDRFMVGVKIVKFTRKSIKLYSNFHQSDLIIASPLCLVNKIAEAVADKEKDVDYLSSV